MDTMEPSLIVQSRFISTPGLFRQLAKSHYNEPGKSDPNLGKTQNTMDQIHRSPTRWETKRKGREGAPRTPSPAMASSPKLQRIGEATTPGREQKTRSREPTGSSPGHSPPPSPRGPPRQKNCSDGRYGRPRRGETPKPTRGQALRERHLLLATPSPRSDQRQGIPREPQGRYGRLPRPLEREPVVQLAQPPPMASRFLNAGTRLAEGVRRIPRRSQKFF